MLATTIDKYCYITCRYLPTFFDYKSSVAWSKVERVQNREDIQHPSVREALAFMDIEDGVAIHHDSDLPDRTGLGSSSSFTIGLLHSLYALKGRMPTRKQLALEAIHIEQERLKESVGSQDQISAAHGGFNRIRFGGDDEFCIEPLIMS